MTALLAAAAVAVTVPCGAEPASATGARSPANGTGSSYAGLAFQQWVDDGQTQGLTVNYTPTSSPQGLQQYEAGIIPFAGTEAEFSSLLGTPDAGIPGGFEYTPDVAGATAVMYNVDDQAGRKVTYLHLSPRTIARIFMGYITNWNNAEITSDNHGLVLPSHPVTIIYRAGQSGTTALFYDFVAHADPGDFVPWANAHHLPTTTRIIQLDNGSAFAPLTEAVSGSDQQAEDVASQSWSISYDEFSYPKTYGAQVAWVENSAGKWTQPYALNITAALAAATLNPDLSQNLSGVYASSNPLSYPISAYSYVVTKCAVNPRFPTCRGTYTDPGVSNTLGAWMSYIACGGQVHMAAIGYAPLPPSLSQDLADSVARITGQVPEALTASNCANPRFNGYLGVGAAGPGDPYLSLATAGLGQPATGAVPAAGGSTTVSGQSRGTSAGTGSGTAGATRTSGDAAAAQVPGRTSVITRPGGRVARSAASLPVAVGQVGQGGLTVGGGSVNYRRPRPVAYTASITGGVPIAPVLVFLAVLIVPVLRIRGVRRFAPKGRRP